MPAAQSRREAAEAAGGAVERRHAVIEAGEHVGERRAARVVEVQGSLCRGELRWSAPRTRRTSPGVAAPMVSLITTQNARSNSATRRLQPPPAQSGLQTGNKKTSTGSRAPSGPQLSPRPHAAIRRNDSSIDWLMFFRLKVSDAAAKIATLVHIRRKARSSPARLGPARVYRTLATAGDAGQHLGRVGHLRHPLRRERCRHSMTSDPRREAIDKTRSCPRWRSCLLVLHPARGPTRPTVTAGAGASLDLQQVDAGWTSSPWCSAPLHLPLAEP